MLNITEYTRLSNKNWLFFKNVSSFGYISYEPNYEEIQIKNNANIPFKIGKQQLKVDGKLESTKTTQKSIIN